MIGWLTWRIGAFILSGLLAVAAGAGLYDAVSSRATIAELRRGNEKLAGWLADAQRNLGTSHANVATLGAAVDQCSADIRDLGKKTEDQDKRNAGRMKDASTALRAVEAKAGQLLAMPRTTVPGTIESCRAGENILRRGAP